MVFALLCDGVGGVADCCVCLPEVSCMCVSIRVSVLSGVMLWLTCGAFDVV